MTNWTKEDFKLIGETLLGLTDSGKEKAIRTHTLIIPEGIKVVDKVTLSKSTIRKLVLPDSLKEIKDAAFLNLKLREVCGGKNIEVIGDTAFSGNNIEFVNGFESLVKIGYMAFLNNKIKSFKFPKTLKRICGNAFMYNTLEEVDLKDLENVNIEERAFCRNKIKHVKLPKSGHLSYHVFLGNFIEEDLEKDAKDKSNLRVAKDTFSDINILKDNKPCDSLFLDLDWIEDDFIIKESTISSLSKDGYQKLISKGCLTIPKFENVDKIGKNFWNKTSEVNEWPLEKMACPKTIYIDEGYKQIEYGAFYSIKYLEIVHLPETIEVIGAEAFSVCEKLREINFPKSLKRINNHAFCSTDIRQADLSQNDKIKNISEGLFRACMCLTNVKFPKNLKKIKKYAFELTEILGVVVIPKSVEEIEKNAFRCSRIKEIHFEENSKLREIGELAFSCKELEVCNLENLKDLKVISKKAFYETKLKSLEIKNEEIAILDSAFAESKIQKARLNVKEIGNCAFQNSDLEDAELTNVDTICSQAFSNCNLKKVIMKNVKNIKRDAFLGNFELNFNIPDDVEIEE